VRLKSWSLIETVPQEHCNSGPGGAIRDESVGGYEFLNRPLEYLPR